MLKNYFKIAYRHILRNKLFSIIDIFGLSMAIGCGIVVFLFVDFWASMDSFHRNGDQIFLVENVINRDGQISIWGDSPLPLGPAIENDFPQIIRTVRIQTRGGVVRYKDKVFNEGFMFVDEGFFDMFTFPLITGSKDALLNHNTLFMDEETALKYFGDENPVGKQLTIKFGDKYVEEFFVGGVTKKYPENSSIRFKFLIPYKKQSDLGLKDFNDWKRWTWATFVQVRNPDDINTIKEQMHPYIKLQNDVNENWSVQDYIFELLTDVSLNSHKIKGGISWGPHPTELIALSIFGIFLLLLACFNYMNIAIVLGTRRLREIGIRKVLGSSRIHLIAQYIGENTLLCLFALILGAVLAKLFFIPSFNSLFDLPLKLDFLGNMRLSAFLASMLVLTSLGGSAYPAFYVSGFQPANILKGKQKPKGKSFFRRTLLTFQFVLTFITVTTAIILVQNAKYQKNRDWGYNQNQVIVVRLDGKKHYTIYRNEIDKNPDILQAAGSMIQIGRGYGGTVAEIAGMKYELKCLYVGHDYLQTMGIRLKEGRFFDKKFSTDLDQSIVINNKFAESMNWKNPLEKKIVIDKKTLFIIGVVDDFHYASFRTKLEPAFFHLAAEDTFNYISVRVKADAMSQTAEYLKKAWARLIPDTPYRSFFQDEVFNSYFKVQNNIIKLFSFTAAITLIIASMGLFGLVSISIDKRMREISIRKVLGATITNVVRIVNKEFVTVLLISTVIAAPLAYLLLKSLFDSYYEYHIPIALPPFVFTFALIAVTSLITISSLIYKVAVSNPVDILREE
ncbi:MAG: ABC transporter permease [Candidatus Aminicenantes bacterium]|nr:ABC transporter permease [Candidatus Aminicenantes bacterium]